MRGSNPFPRPERVRAAHPMEWTYSVAQESRIGTSFKSRGKVTGNLIDFEDRLANDKINLAHSRCRSALNSFADGRAAGSVAAPRRAE